MYGNTNVIVVIMKKKIGYSEIYSKNIQKKNKVKCSVMY